MLPGWYIYSKNGKRHQNRFRPSELVKNRWLVFVVNNGLQARGGWAPSCFLGNQLSCALTNAQDSKHGVDARHVREDAGVCDSDILEPTDLEGWIDDGHTILLDVTHLSGTGRMVDGVMD